MSLEASELLGHRFISTFKRDKLKMITGHDKRYMGKAVGPIRGACESQGPGTGRAGEPVTKSTRWSGSHFESRNKLVLLIKADKAPRDIFEKGIW